MFFFYMLYLHLNQQQISKQHVIFLCVTLLHLYTCHMALGWEQLQLTPPSCLSLFLSLSFSVSLSPCVSPSVSLTPSHPSLSPLPPALVCITGFPPLQSPILFHGNWLSMRGSGGGAGGGGEGGGWVWHWEEELLLQNGGYLHYTRTECSESTREDWTIHVHYVWTLGLGAIGGQIVQAFLARVMGFFVG